MVTATSANLALVLNFKKNPVIWDATALIRDFLVAKIVWLLFQAKLITNHSRYCIPVLPNAVHNNRCLFCLYSLIDLSAYVHAHEWN